MLPTPRPPFSAILLDLDGTITDSAPGITDTLAYTFEQLGMPVPEYEQLLRWVGPPIMDSFRDLAGMDAATADRALAIYRERYLDRGAYDATLFDGMGTLVQQIAAAGIPLSLATSKPELPATLMLEHFTIAQCFTVITGASADETRSEKADVVEEALRRLRELDVPLDNVVMVGDRIHDIEGAAAHGVPTIAVTWGYGSDAEHAEAALVASSTDELRSLLGLPAKARPAA
ncbi:HAD hydrolase-like protein [Microcella alkalica]|uniref:HAD hydrolase-like protein n=1 Tax=Microcella alkalica TaxID=355930 RepID=UPI00145E0A09|nr:HAD hydrolase-like protein [Microcella alkalica]